MKVQNIYIIQYIHIYIYTSLGMYEELPLLLHMSPTYHDMSAIYVDLLVVSDWDCIGGNTTYIPTIPLLRTPWTFSPSLQRVLLAS